LRLLIDADVLVYELAHSEQQTYSIPITNEIGALDHYFLSVAREGEATLHLERRLEDMKEALGADEMKLLLSYPGATFRHTVYPGYKSARIPKKKPLLYHRLREIFVETYDATMVKGLEGDDLLGLEQASDDDIICTIDKDLKTVPGYHYNWQKPEEGVVFLDPVDAYYNFLLQAFMGDSTDGYGGCPGIGPKTATKQLGGVNLTDAWEDVIVPAYEKKGLSRQVAESNARCAWILRRGDYDWATKEIINTEPWRNPIA
jgi:hypothetical protein